MYSCSNLQGSFVSTHVAIYYHYEKQHISKERSKQLTKNLKKQEKQNPIEVKHSTLSISLEITSNPLKN